MTEHVVGEAIPEEIENDGFSTFVALLIAIASIAGAIIAWRASVASDGVGDSDLAGLRATINLTEARALTAVEIYHDYGKFGEFYYQRQLALAIETEAATEFDALSEEELNTLYAEVAESYDRATQAQQNFPNIYLNRDGTYALERQRGEMLADAARQRDLNPLPSFAEADALRQQTDRLLLTVAAIGLGIIFYTLTEILSQRVLRYLFVLLGSVLAIGGAVAAFLIETGRV
jgi:hypothetical protein